MNRITARASVAAACCLAAVLVPVAAQAAAPAHATTWDGGGFVATPKHLHRATINVVVPELPCSARSASRTLEAGLLGTRKQDSHVVPWSVAVVASCAAGVTRYQAAASDSPGRGGMRVHPGDIVSLTKGPGKSFEIFDRTSGAAEGLGGSMGGQRVHTVPRVLIGGVLTGRLPGHLAVRFSGVRVNRMKLGNLPFHRRAQFRHGNRVVRAGHLDDAATGFALRVS